ncbi:MAG: NUDIX domain-containing protein [Rhodoferax sp.]|uniref:GDP-mannose mannosyl hydrolase n=1 Tax=Rhodoferax sp. TaxID=50421 RepID=UPI002ACD8DA1|nr:NUDIX domain-containing protein [Rhodoferax sp.]MDZ7891338.1 NUDIX domain-containing protein [Rhodoferax sp.]
MLSKDVFLGVVDAAPLVAMDMVVVRGGTEILLGLRNNRPAQGYWFVPGGRIRKNEPMQAALARVAQDELGLQLAALPVPPRHIGAFEHFYTDCFTGDNGVSTHYVVMGNLIALPAGTELAAADAQHSALRWWPLAQAQASEQVHRFTKDYVDAILLSNM